MATSNDSLSQPTLNCTLSLRHLAIFVDTAWSEVKKIWPERTSHFRDMECLRTFSIAKSAKIKRNKIVRSFFIRVSLRFGLRLNALNIIVSIGYEVVIFHSYKPTGSTNTFY